jgi:hypothetical protein
VPEDVTARHRAGGVGRLLAVRTAAPRHAAPEPFTAGATLEIRLPRPRRRPLALALAVLAVLLLAAVTPLARREPETPQVAVPLPAISVPPPPTAARTASPAATRRALQAIRQAAKASPAPSATPTSAPATTVPRVLLGPASDADVGPLLASYCRETYGRFSLAVATAESWVCARLGRAVVAVDMDAMCRRRYGDSAWADLGRATDPRSWRCYRDGP